MMSGDRRPGGLCAEKDFGIGELLGEHAIGGGLPQYGTEVSFEVAEPGAEQVLGGRAGEHARDDVAGCALYHPGGQAR
jgi:hypothetical protein